MLRSCLVVLVLAAFTISPDTSGRAPATPAEPTAVILDAFRSHAIVALGEGQHWNLQSHAYRLSLLRDPRLAQAIDDIVVEFGDARYQDLMDRYFAGDDVPDHELRHVWEDTTMANTVFDRPIYEELLRTVHDVNRSLRGGRRLRVLLGDPPAEWERIADGDAILDLMYRRNTFAADLVRREVLAKGRHALLLYADGHLFRKGEETVPSFPP
jgi:hypothetical protein